MKFRKTLASLCLLILAASTTALEGQVVQEQYNEGVDYLVLPDKHKEDAKLTPASPGEDIEVVEFFGYPCPHCNRFEPYIKDWLKLKADDVVFRREHVSFQSSWIPLSRAFYAAEELKILDRVHDTIFSAIHNRGINLARESMIQQLFKNVADVDKATFEDKYWSKEVQERIKSTRSQIRAWSEVVGINDFGVPFMVVGGQYLVDTTRAEEDQAKMLEIVDFLVDKLRSEVKESNPDSEVDEEIGQTSS